MRNTIWQMLKKSGFITCPDGSPKRFPVLSKIINRSYATVFSKQQQRVDEAVRKADFVSAIEHMPNGIYNYINKNYVIDGYELSGGMQQTLAMIRAYYRDAGCIILDELTAMLDASSESKI